MSIAKSAYATICSQYSCWVTPSCQSSGIVFRHSGLREPTEISCDLGRRLSNKFHATCGCSSLSTSIAAFLFDTGAHVCGTKAKESWKENLLDDLTNCLQDLLQQALQVKPQHGRDNQGPRRESPTPKADLSYNFEPKIPAFSCANIHVNGRYRIQSFFHSVKEFSRCSLRQQWQQIVQTSPQNPISIYRISRTA